VQYHAVIEVREGVYSDNSSDVKLRLCTYLGMYSRKGCHTGADRIPAQVVVLLLDV
jgi:hypothetical protein